MTCHACCTKRQLARPLLAVLDFTSKCMNLSNVANYNMHWLGIICFTASTHALTQKKMHNWRVPKVPIKDENWRQRQGGGKQSNR